MLHKKKCDHDLLYPLQKLVHKNAESFAIGFCVVNYRSTFNWLVLHFDCNITRNITIYIVRTVELVKDPSDSLGIVAS